MLASVAIARARGCSGGGCRYRLGAGGMHPAAPWPWRLEGPRECDCSGFVSWCLGVSRKTSNPYYAALNGGWLETSAIVRDARSPFGVVVEVARTEARPGDLLVYGDHHGTDGTRRQGHVGLVSLCDAGGPVQMVHCSLGNDRRAGDAIQETDCGWMFDRGGLVVRVAWVEAG